jgi:hypothetical protein
MRQVRLIAACFLLLLGASPQRTAISSEARDTPHQASAPDELTQRRAMMEEIHQHIDARDFAWLDSMGRSLRTERSRTASGVWKLELYYNSMWDFGEIGSAPDCTDPAEAIIADWRRLSPNSPAPFITSAERLLAKAWCLRGSGYASEVADGAWKPFYDHLDAAYEMLARHKAVASVDPNYYAVMASIYVAQGRDEEEFRALLDEGTRKEPFYYALYSEAFRYYEPQWGGSYAAEEGLARFAVEKTKAKDRNSAFARIYWVAMDCGCMPPAEAVNQPMLRQSMADLAEIYPDPWNVSHMARMACAIDDGDLARHYFDALPQGDGGKSGWANANGFDVPSWQACRAAAGLPSGA